MAITATLPYVRHTAPEIEPAAGYGAVAPWNAASQSVSMATINLCLNRPGAVQITELVPQGGNHQLRVTDFATRPSLDPDGRPTAEQSRLGAAPGSLGAIDFPAGGRATVTARCVHGVDEIKAGSFDELGATFERTGSGDGSMTSLLVCYRTNRGQQRHLTIDWAVTLRGPRGAESAPADG